MVRKEPYSLGYMKKLLIWLYSGTKNTAAAIEEQQAGSILFDCTNEIPKMVRNKYGSSVILPRRLLGFQLLALSIWIQSVNPNIPVKSRNQNPG